MSNHDLSFILWVWNDDDVSWWLFTTWKTFRLVSYTEKLIFYFSIVQCLRNESCVWSKFPNEDNTTLVSIRSIIWSWWCVVLNWSKFFYNLSNVWSSKYVHFVMCCQCMLRISVLLAFKLLTFNRTEQWLDMTKNARKNRYSIQ